VFQNPNVNLMSMDEGNGDSTDQNERQQPTLQLVI
jgi:hypothetical protein